MRQLSYLSFSSVVRLLALTALPVSLATVPAHAQVADSDGDTIPNDIDTCWYWNYGDTDSDGDGIGDSCDNCPNTPGYAPNWDGDCGYDCVMVWDPNGIECTPMSESEPEPEPEPVDAGPSDAGAPTTDAGAPDAGTPDAGAADAGAPDAGAPDGGVFVDLLPTSPPCDPTVFTAYPDRTPHSPISCRVAENLRQILDGDRGAVAKVGDSISFGSENMGCFVDSIERPFRLSDTGHGHLADTRDALAATLDRSSLAAQVGQAAPWATSGNPSPIAREIAETDAAFGVLMFGANDVGSPGQSYVTDNAELYAAEMVEAVEAMIADGTIPILVTQPPMNGAGYPAWAPSLARYYAQIVRAIAQRFQVPFIDLQTELEGLPNLGLRDGVHLSEANYDRRCDFSPDGLQYGANVRHLRVMEALDRVSEILDGGHWDPDNGYAIAGSGTSSDPFVIDAVPFIDTGDSRFVVPPAASCAPMPELATVYEVNLPAAVELRAQLFDLDGSSHAIRVEESGGCVSGDEQVVAGTFGPGVVRFVVSPYTTAGEYLLVIGECDGCQ